MTLPSGIAASSSDAQLRAIYADRNTAPLLVRGRPRLRRRIADQVLRPQVFADGIEGGHEFLRILEMKRSPATHRGELREKRRTRLPDRDRIDQHIRTAGPIDNGRCRGLAITIFTVR